MQADDNPPIFFSNADVSGSDDFEGALEDTLSLQTPSGFKAELMDKSAASPCLDMSSRRNFIAGFDGASDAVAPGMHPLAGRCFSPLSLHLLHDSISRRPDAVASFA